MRQDVCLNCNEPLQHDVKYCSNCSQKAGTHRLTLPEISHEAFHAITHADKGFLYLMKELIFRPGHVARDFIEGKRKKYFNPFSFLVIVTGILVLASSNLKFFGSVMEKSEAQTRMDVEKMSKEKAGFHRRSVAFGDFINNHSNLLPFFSTPFIAFFFWLLYKKRKLYYAEHLASMAFFNGFIMIVTALVFGPLIFFTKNYGLHKLWLPLMFFFHIAYFSFGYKQLFKMRGAKGALKAFGNSIVATFCWIIFSTAIGTLYIMFGK